MDEEVGPLERDRSLRVVLPGGLEKTATVHGSQPVMDLLVTLCASYHLNPSDYTVEALSADGNVGLKANSPVGLLEVEKLVLKAKGAEERVRRPYMPEATVRLLVNYHKSHKTVVRVSPRLPLALLLPAVCAKCEFNVDTTVLLRDRQAPEPLDLAKSLNEHGLREVFARDAERGSPEGRAATPEPEPTPPGLPAAETPAAPPPEPPKKEARLKEDSGFFSLFRRRKKKKQQHERDGPLSAPASPGLGKRADGALTPGGVFSSGTLPADTPKKRRAPQPPMGASVSVPNYLSSCHLGTTQRSAESILRSTKRRAPPPPGASPLKELQTHSDAKASLVSANALERLRESDESDSVSVSSPHPSQPPPSSSSRSSLAQLQEVAEPYLPAFRGRDLSDARAALARVLTSSVSKGTLMRRLRKTANLSKLPHGSSHSSSSYDVSDGDVFGAEPELVFKSDLPTEREWEDPLQRRGVTTFKVVPLKKTSLPGAEGTPEIPEGQESPGSEGGASPEDAGRPEETQEDQPEIEAPLSSEGTQTPPPLPCDDRVSSGDTEEPEVEPTEWCEPEATDECGVDSKGREESFQGGDAQPWNSSADHEEVQEDEGEEGSFPPPPPPVFFSEELDTMRGRGAPASASLPPSPVRNGRCEAPGSPSAGPRRSLSSSASSRFAQAVATAVLRSRRKSSGPQASAGSVPSPPRSPYQYGA